MRLADVANRFNDLLCVDAYTGMDAFYAQLDLYDDNKRDSETGERRVLSVAKKEVIPSRRVVAAAETRWIIGHGNPDSYRGETIRVGYVAHEATFLSQVRTIAQVCLGQPGFSAWAGRSWVKDESSAAQTSKLYALNHINFSRSETLVADLLVTFEDRLNIVRSLDFGVGGTIVATCEQMDEPAVETGQILSGAYDPVQDTIAAISVPVRVVRMRWQSLFSYRSSLAPKFQPGDIQVAIAKSAVTMVVGASLTLSDGSWRIESFVSEGGVWLCRAVRNG